MAGSPRQLMDSPHECEWSQALFSGGALPVLPTCSQPTHQGAPFQPPKGKVGARSLLSAWAVRFCLMDSPGELN